MATAVSQLQSRTIRGIADASHRPQQEGWLRQDLDLEAFAAWFAGQIIDRIVIELGGSEIDQSAWNSISADAVRHVLLGSTELPPRTAMLGACRSTVDEHPGDRSRGSTGGESDCSGVRGHRLPGGDQPRCRPGGDRRGWDAATRFFDLPLADKMAVAMPYPGYPYGYAPMQGERLAASLGDDTPPDLKETFSMGPIERPAHPPADPAEAFVYEPTPWPSALPELQPSLEAYYSAMSDLVARIMTLFADALELPSNFFESRIDRHTSALRLLNYPALNEPPEPGQLRAGAHTDYGTVTVFRADDSAGRIGSARAFADWGSVDGRAGRGRVVGRQSR